jgi:uncharacterized protein
MPYEPAAMKRLMGRYTTRQEEIDRFLRAGLFTDCSGGTMPSARVWKLFIKQLEPFYGFDARLRFPREVALAVSGQFGIR